MTWLGAFAAAARSGAFTVRQTWRHAPGWLIRLVAAHLVLAITPSAQVLAVSWLVRSVDGDARDFVAPLIILIALVGVGQVIGNAANFTQQRVRTRMRRHYQDDLMHTVAALPPQRLAQPETTALIEACRGALLDIGHLVGSVIASIAALVTAATLCATVWMISPIAGVLVVAALVPFLVVFAWESKMQDEAFARHGFWERRSNYAVEQLVTHRTATELTTLGSGAVVADIADQHRARADSIMDRILVLLIRGDAVGAAGTAVLLGGALAGIVLRGAGGAGIAAGIVAVLAGLEATRSAGFSFGDLISHGPKVAAYRRLIDSVPGEPDDHVELSPEQGIEAAQVTVSYPGRDHAAVTDVSLSAGPGMIIALVGVNGAGKTTTVNAIMGLLDLDDGKITVDGVDLTTVPNRQRLAMFGLLTQEFGRYEFTVRDVVRIGRPDGRATDDEIWRALDSAHAADFIRALPQGLDTQLGPQFGGAGLSGGQWQRLSLARIYLRDAPIWILDEPTSAIDAEAEQQIFAELQRTKAGRITIVVSHRAWTLRGMDHIYVFDRGRIVDHGNYDELLARGGRFAEIFAEQVG
jgi:ATP-binding cassette subfamily B protein